MPIYEYECEKCGHRFELLQKFSDPPARSCPECKGRKVHRLTSAPAIQFKGEGWYVTDYSDKGKATRAEGTAEAKSGSVAAETKSGDGKTADGKSADSKSADKKAADSKGADAGSGSKADKKVADRKAAPGKKAD